MPGSPATAGGKVTYNDVEYTIIKEGLAEILQQPNGPKVLKPGQILPSPADVFYNPIQQFNRDLSTVVIRVFAEVFATDRKAKHQRPRHSSNTHGKEQSATGEAGKSNPDEETESGNDAGSPTKRKRDEVGNGFEEVGSTKRTKTSETSIDEAGDRHYVGHETSSDKIPTGPAAALKPPFRILDALSATGLRALRYSKEIEQVTLVVATDISAAAVEKIKLHTQHNNLRGKVHAIAGDAKFHMYRIGSDASPVLPDGERGKYHVIDLDPYGSAMQFVDAAVQAVQDGGLLCVTCTDAGVFASVGYLEKTYALYGGLPIKGVHSHEGGLRLIIHAIASSAAKYGLAIEPLLSLSIDFYARVFVRVRKSANEVKLLAGKTVAVYTCDSGCGAWTVQPFARTQTYESRKGDKLYKFTAGQAPSAGLICPHCGFKPHLSGPMWGGYLHNPFFIQRVLDLLPTLDKEIYKTIPRMQGMLSTARDEMLLPSGIFSNPKPDTSADTSAPKTPTTLIAPLQRLPADLRDLYPFYIVPSQLCKILHCEAPSSNAIRSALLGLGYRVTRSHAKAGSIRTDASWSVMWEIMREWLRQKAPLKRGPKPGTPGFGILRKDRSKRNLNAICEEMTSIASQAQDAEDAQNKLRALLWRLEHPDPPADATRDKRETGEKKAPREQPTGTNGTIVDKTDTSTLEIVFDEALGKEPTGGEKIVRYQSNPRANWGPQIRAR